MVVSEAVRKGNSGNFMGGLKQFKRGSGTWVQLFASITIFLGDEKKLCLVLGLDRNPSDNCTPSNFLEFFIKAFRGPNC